MKDFACAWRGHRRPTCRERASGFDLSNARTVRVRNGVPAVTDAPFAEGKEHLAGYYVLDRGDRARLSRSGGDDRPAHQPWQAADQGERHRIRLAGALHSPVATAIVR
jgi:hypothetical protein